MKVVIIDYGLGNLRSVAGAVRKLGFTPCISSEPEGIASADKLILPGVGAFGDGMKNLKHLGLLDVLNEQVVKKGVSILGICLGFQLMARQSYEFGTHSGLGWIDGVVERFQLETYGLRVPHVGWNELIQIKKSRLFKDIPQNSLFYYVHSYFLKSGNADVTVGICDYGIKFTCVFEQKNIFGTQFHPEKSQYCGLTLLNNFLNL